MDHISSVCPRTRVVGSISAVHKVRQALNGQGVCGGWSTVTSRSHLVFSPEKNPSFCMRNYRKIVKGRDDERGGGAESNVTACHIMCAAA